MKSILASMAGESMITLKASTGAVFSVNAMPIRADYIDGGFYDISYVNIFENVTYKDIKVVASYIVANLENEPLYNLIKNRHGMQVAKYLNQKDINTGEADPFYAELLKDIRVIFKKYGCANIQDALIIDIDTLYSKVDKIYQLQLKTFTEIKKCNVAIVPLPNKVTGLCKGLSQTMTRVGWNIIT